MSHLYVCLFSTGHIKVGRSVDPQSRIAAHADRQICSNPLRRAAPEQGGELQRARRVSAHPGTHYLPPAERHRDPSLAVAGGFARPVSLSGAGFSFT